MILLTGDLAEGVVTLKLTQQWPVIWGGVAGRIYLSWGEHNLNIRMVLGGAAKTGAPKILAICWQI